MKKHPEWVHKSHDWAIRVRQFPFLPGWSLTGRERYAPFFIVGAGRSGTTLLRRLLTAHDGMHIPPETYVLGPMIKAFRQYGRMRWKDMVYLLLSKLEFHPEFYTFGISLGELARELEDIDPANRNLAFVLNRFYHYHAEKTGVGCVRWGDKTPINTFSLDRILKVFPDARFLNMIRNGYDVIVSYASAGIHTDIEEAAQRWLLSVTRARQFADKHPGVLLDVRYESLVSDKSAAMRRIADFIDIEFQPNSFSAETESRVFGDVEVHEHHSRTMEPIDDSRIGRGSERLTADEILKVNRIIKPELERFGYAVLR